MAKRWDEKEDRFIIAYFDAVGSLIGPHDLGRTESATINRARFLKKSGAWKAYINAEIALNHARSLAGRT